MAPPSWAYQVEYFNPPPDEELICSICRCVFCEPLKCPCHHVFCKVCICKWLGIHRSCPICRKRTSESLLHPVVPLIKNMIMKMTLHCHNSESGCSSVFTLESCENHLKQCLFEMEECSNGCGKTVIRREMLAHKRDECPCRYVECPKCGMKVFGDLTQHECINYLKALIKDIEKERDEYMKQVEELKQKIEELKQQRQRRHSTTGSSFSTFDRSWSSCSDSSLVSSSLNLTRRNASSTSSSSDSESSNFLNNLITGEPEDDSLSLSYNPEGIVENDDDEEEDDDDANEQDNHDDVNGDGSPPRSLLDHFLITFEEQSDVGEENEPDSIHQSPPLEDESVIVIPPDSTQSSPRNSDIEPSLPNVTMRTDRCTLKRRLSSLIPCSADWTGEHDAGSRKAQKSNSNICDVDCDSGNSHSMPKSEQNPNDEIIGHPLVSESESLAIPSSSSGNVGNTTTSETVERANFKSKSKQRQPRKSEKRVLGKAAEKCESSSFASKNRRNRIFENTLSLLEHSVDSDPDWEPDRNQLEISSSTSSRSPTTSSSMSSISRSVGELSSDSSDMSELETDTSYEVKVPDTTLDLLERYAMYDSEDDSDYTP